MVHKAEAIEHHRFDGITGGEVPHFRVLLGGLVNDVANAEFVEHASDEAEVVQDLAAVGTVAFGMAISSYGEEILQGLRGTQK